MIEEERKYEVDPGFRLPPLAEALPKGGKVVPLPAKTLRATYYDTDTARLARAGISIRYRSGERGKPPWTVKLPTTGAAESRDEISREGTRRLPDDLVALLTAYHRGAELAPAVTIRTQRRAYELRDRDGEVLAEVADDTVSVLDGREVTGQFREIEVERKAGRDKLLDKVEAILLEAGATRGKFLPKHARAMGERAAGKPDLTPPAPPSRHRPHAGEVVVTALRKHIEKIFQADPYLRLRSPMPDGDTPVHQMRVGCRRLRSDLRTFKPLLDPQWSDNLRAGASWLAEVLGHARDAEVLRERLQRTAGLDPVAPLDPAAVARFDADLAARHEDALQALEDVLGSERYATLLDVLVEAAREPQLGPAARERADIALTRLVARPWRQLSTTGRGRIGAGDLDLLGIDDDWHSVRIRAKRARYAVESVAKLIGGDAAALGESLTEVQELLGEHQDAAIAADTWLAIARSDVDDHALAVAAGRLVERERAAVRRARERFPAAWAAADTAEHTGWLRS
jgi:CHAD domain-containing protein/adenylate cyclase class IV